MNSLSMSRCECGFDSFSNPSHMITEGYHTHNNNRNKDYVTSPQNLVEFLHNKFVLKCTAYKLDMQKKM